MTLRKVIIAACFDKIGKLSLKSLSETNSGKLITLISSDLFAIERPISASSMILAAPLINLICYAIIWVNVGWVYAVTTFILWIVMLFFQWFTSK